MQKDAPHEVESTSCCRNEDGRNSPKLRKTEENRWKNEQMPILNIRKISTKMVAHLHIKFCLSFFCCSKERFYIFYTM